MTQQCMDGLTGNLDPLGDEWIVVVTCQGCGEELCIPRWQVVDGAVEFCCPVCLGVDEV